MEQKINLELSQVELHTLSNVLSSMIIAGKNGNDNTGVIPNLARKLEDLCGKNHFEFDYEGWKYASAVSTVYTQKEWNQTLITKFNQMTIFGIATGRQPYVVVVPKKFEPIISELIAVDYTAGQYSFNGNLIEIIDVDTDCIFIGNKKLLMKNVPEILF